MHSDGLNEHLLKTIGAEINEHIIMEALLYILLPSAATTITTKFFATNHTSYQHDKTYDFTAYLI